MSDGNISDNPNTTIFESGEEDSSDDEIQSQKSNVESDSEIVTNIENEKIEDNDDLKEIPKFVYTNHRNMNNENDNISLLDCMLNYKLRVSKFDLISVISKRAQSLSRGAIPLVVTDETDDEVTTTIKEIDSDLFIYIIKHDNLNLKFKDFEQKSLKFHLDNIKSNLNN